MLVVELDAIYGSYYCDQVFIGDFMVEWTENSADSYSDTTMFNVYYEEWSIDYNGECTGWPAESYYSLPLSSGDAMTVDSDYYYTYDTDYYYDYNVYDCYYYSDYGFTTSDDCYYWNYYASWYNDYGSYYYDNYSDYYYCAYDVLFEYTSGSNSTESVIPATSQWVVVYTNTALATAASAVVVAGATALLL